MTNTSTRGRTFTGVVTSDSMRKTVTVEWNRRHYIPKYERYEKRRTHVKAHNPEEVDARVGDEVIIQETKPMSKTKHFTIIRKVGADEKAEEAVKEEAKPEKQAEEKPSKDDTAKKTSTKKTTKKSTAKKSTTKKSTSTKKATKKTTKKSTTKKAAKKSE